MYYYIDKYEKFEVAKGTIISVNKNEEYVKGIGVGDFIRLDHNFNEKFKVRGVNFMKETFDKTVNVLILI